MSDLLDRVLALKDLDRAGWKRAGINAPESVAAHSWGVAWLVLALCPDDLDPHLALRMAVIHDLAEVEVGDITPYDGVSAEEKSKREAKAINTLLAERPDLAALWYQYEAQDTPEARFVREADRLDMALQAVRYARERGVDTAEFVDSAKTVVQHPVLLAVLKKK